MLKKIDDFILVLFQKTSDWFQRWFGVNNFLLSRIFLFIATAAELIVGMDRWQMNGFSLVSIFFTLLYAVITIFILKIILEAEWSWKNNPLFSNGYTEEFALWRFIAFLFLIVFFILNFLNIFYGLQTKGYSLSEVLLALINEISHISCIYLASCTPKPPSKSKSKKIFHSLMKSISQNTSSVGT